MSKKDELPSENVATGICAVAAAVLISPTVSAEELELAGRILKRTWPSVEHAPREHESIAAAFNRHMDAAIDSCNDSAGEPTRSARRSLLARDLDKAGLILLDRATVVELLERAGA